MLLTLSYAPGQVATVFLETLDEYGQRADGYAIPLVTRIVYPDLSLAAGYPTDMIQLDVGLYYYQFVLPTGALAVGSYLVDISYDNPSTGYVNTELYQIIVTAPYGNYSALTGGCPPIPFVPEPLPCPIPILPPPCPPEPCCPPVPGPFPYPPRPPWRRP